jgi:DNA-binding CsgD family transcriptional regulator
MRNQERIYLLGVAALLAVHRDEVAAAREYVREGVSSTASSVDRERGGWLQWARALLHERDGRDRDALDVMAGLVATPPTAGLVSQRLYYTADAVRLAVRFDEHTLATDAVRALEPVARVRLPTETGKGALLHCEGLLRGDPEPLLRAAEHYHAASRPQPAADAGADAAVTLAGRGDNTEARRALAAAEEIYSRLGAQWDLIRVAARARDAGLRRGAPRRAARPLHGWAALTDTEAKVAELVTAGRSNSEIAAHLLLSVRTVQTHVSHILRKLDATSRVEVVRHRNASLSSDAPTSA